MHRQLWMDEIHTWLIVTDPSLSHSMAALENGADFNPPTYYLALRGFLSVTGQSYAAMRWFSLICVAVGLGIVATMLRRTYSTATVLASVAVVAIQPILIQQSTEARFYALWFALFAAFCFVRSRRSDSFRSHAAAGCLAVLICTTHYFGVLSLGLVFLVEAGSMGREGKRLPELIGFVAPYVAGVVAVGCCFGFYLGQRSVLTVPTWISPPTLSKTKIFLLGFVPVVLLAIAGLGRLLASESERSSEVSRPFQNSERLLLGSLGMPVLLVTFSYLVQPALVDRYAIVTLLAWAPAFAIVLKNTRQWFAIMFSLLCVVIGFDNVNDLVAKYDRIESERNRLAAELTSLPQAVVFEDRIDHYPARLEYPNAPWYLLDFEQVEEERRSALRTVQRDVGRSVGRFYANYPLADVNKLVADGHREVVLVPYRSDLADETSPADVVRLQNEYPGFAIERIARRIFRLRWNGISASVTP